MPENAFITDERDQLNSWAQLTYAERLQWLWNAKMFAERAKQARLTPINVSRESEEPRLSRS